MAWILPTGVEDPGGVWVSAGNALDGSLASFATREALDEVPGGLELILTFPHTVTGIIRVGASLDYRIGIVYLWGWDGNGWRAITDFYISPDPAWYVWPHGDVTVSKVKIQIHQRWPEQGDVRIHALAIDASCSGPLKDICAFFRDVGTFFIDLSLDIAELWLIGQYLCIPFEFLGEVFYAGADTCCSVSSRLASALDVAAASLTWDTLLSLILESSPTLYYLITDPVGWFLVQLTLAFNLEPWHTQSLEFLAKWVLETYFPTLYTFWLDPSGEIVRWVSQYSSFVAGLFIDPAKQIRWTIGEILGILPGMYDHPEAWPEMLFEGHFPTLYEFWLDPEEWLLEYVDPRILGLPATVAAFFDDPWGWLFDELEDQIEVYADQIGDLALEIVARLLGV